MQKQAQGSRRLALSGSQYLFQEIKYLINFDPTFTHDLQELHLALVPHTVYDPNSNQEIVCIIGNLSFCVPSPLFIEHVLSSLNLIYTPLFFQLKLFKY